MISSAAIVGRPNVGKSTLYNALLDRKKALVSSNPGMTRDRTYSLFYPTAGKKCLLVYTGGLIMKTGDPFEEKINMQVDAALKQAEIILFVVDLKEGLLPADEDVAQKLRKTSKPVLLVVNKADLPLHEKDSAEFYSLGFKNMVTVSAMHKRNISACVDFISSNLRLEKERETEPGLRVLSIAGKPNVGKSTLVNKISGEERVIVDRMPGTTRNPARCPVELQGHSWELADLAGMWRKKRGKKAEDLISMTASRKEIEFSDVTVLMMDLTLPLSFQDKRIGGWIIESGCGVVAAGNKYDLTEKNEGIKEAYEISFRQTMPYLDFAPFILISASTGKGLENLYRTVNRVYLNAHKRVPQEELDLFLKKAVDKKPPPPAANERPRVISMAQTGVNPPVFTIFVRHPRLDKIQQSWKNYIRNSIYREFKYYGVPVKVKLKSSLKGTR